MADATQSPEVSDFEVRANNVRKCAEENQIEIMAELRTTPHSLFAVAIFGDLKKKDEPTKETA
jgi:hypothetical protein